MTFALDMLPRASALEAVDVAQGSPEWLALRREGVGASDVAILLGLCDWDGATTPAELAAEKRGERIVPESWAMRLGTCLEASIVEWWARGVGAEICTVPSLFEREAPWRRVNLDRLARMPDGEIVAVEVKFTRRKPKELPAYYHAQVTRQLGLTGLAKGFLVWATPWDVPYPAATDSAKHAEPFLILRDDEYAAHIGRVVDEWWFTSMGGL